MTRYRRTSTPSFSASSRAPTSGRTVNPITTASEPGASGTSLPAIRPPPGARREGQRSVVLRDRSHASVDDLDPNLVLRKLLQGVEDGLQRPLHVGLDDEVEGGQLPLPGSPQRPRGGRGGAGRRQLGGARLGLPFLRDVAGLSLVGDGPELLARLWHVRP